MFRAMMIPLIGSVWMCGLPSAWMSPSERLSEVGTSSSWMPV